MEFANSRINKIKKDDSQMLAVKKPKTIRLSDKEMVRIANNVAKPVLKYIRKQISKELSNHPEAKRIEVNDFIYLVIMAMTNVDGNILIFLRNFYKSQVGKEIDYDKFMQAYLQNLCDIMARDDDKRAREKMN